MATRKSITPGETFSPMNAPPVRLGLLAKLNLLAIGLIVATAIGISGFLVSQQVRDEQQRLRTQGLTIASMLAELAEYSVYTSDTASLRQMLDSLAADRDIAYVDVLDASRRMLAWRDFGVPG